MSSIAPFAPVSFADRGKRGRGTRPKLAFYPGPRTLSACLPWAGMFRAFSASAASRQDILSDRPSSAQRAVPCITPGEAPGGRRNPGLNNNPRLRPEGATLARHVPSHRARERHIMHPTSITARFTPPPLAAPVSLAVEWASRPLRRGGLLNRPRHPRQPYLPRALLTSPVLLPRSGRSTLQRTQYDATFLALFRRR